MTPFVSDPDLTLYIGDCLGVLRELPDGCVDACVTSPPYWGLRDYGTEGQLGLEASPAEYVAAMVAVFAEVRRVLSDHGTLWLNLGDSYAGSGRGPSAMNPAQEMWNANTPDGLKAKDLVGIPWRVAFALQTDGWYLRSDIIWAKPNPMPESVTDRPTKAHEYVFLLSKGPRYFFDQEAVREPQSTPHDAMRPVYGPGDGWVSGPQAARRNGGDNVFGNPAGRNVRSVWQIATQPYADAHFATFPEELPRRCILAGCPEWVCGTCGKARERITGRETQPEAYEDRKYDRSDPRFATKRNMGGRYQAQLDANPIQTVGWWDCGHNDYRPGTVLDPFFGSGTTGLVARKHGRRTIGIELNPGYARMAARRLQQLSLLA